MEWKKIISTDAKSKELISKIHKQLNIKKKNKQPNLKNGQKSSTDIFPKNTLRANQHMKRC